jgi:ATP-dependent helicase/nuclease subunit B
MAGLRAAGSARLQPGDIGTFVHSVLEQFVKRVYDEGNTLGAIKDEYITKLIDELSEVYLRDVIRSYDYKSGRFKYLLGRLRSTLVTLAKNLRTEFRDCAFVPSGFEVKIGEDGDVPPLTISSPEGELKIYGYVDRVDTFENGGRTYLRVVDYKTGKKVFRISDVLAGLNLQMLIYLFVICRGGEDRFGQQPTPAGILYMPAGRPEYDSGADYTEEKALEQADKALKRNGLLLEDTEILEAMEKGLSGAIIPASVKKDGTLSQRSSVASASRLGSLERYIGKLLSELAQEVRRGSAQTNPYRDTAHNACRYCELRPVCRVEYGSPELRDFQSVGQEEAWETIENKSEEIRNKK